ncbi:hypothetical protein [Polyangium sp. y55x31]|uniref:hypothetical protein n=1 Tax=Polyangium sp. y55x31 TaxID=3042688 RepID=UPI002482974E|nr:hypothetical protein [Polyangium sp. y55x31]MDI1484806.1 hypothetical protein [Polyangium sp. y55x31]
MRPYRTKAEPATSLPPRRPPKRCPRCALISPSSARRCQCGYDFQSGHASQELEQRSESHFYWMGIGGLTVLLGAGLLASGIMFPWLLVGGALVLAKGFFGWRDARADIAENDGAKDD